MMGLITLRPEDVEILVHGSVLKWGSGLSSSWLWNHRENALGKSWGNPSTDGVDLRLAAEWWSRRYMDLALLLAPQVSGKDEDTSLIAFALARAEGGPRTIGKGARQVRIAEWIRLPRSISLRHLMSAMPTQHSSTLNKIAKGLSRPLPPGAASALEAALTKEFPDFESTARGLRERGSQVRPAPRTPRSIIQRDATTTALRLFAARWKDLQPVESPEDPPAEVGEPIATAFTERDAIVDDSAIFPGWRRSTRSRSGWWEFYSEGRRLLVKSIDATHYESQSGADLIYMRRNPDAFVLVQYKLLRPGKDGRLIYKIDDRLQGQLHRMIKICRPMEASENEEPGQWRLGAEAAFVKFVDPTENRDDDLLSGYYVPAELAVLQLKEQAARQPLRRELDVEGERYLDSRTFIRLVGDSWVGTLRDPTEMLRALLLEAKELWRRADVTFAYDAPVQSG